MAAQLIAQSPRDPRIEDWTARIVNAVGRADRMLVDLLDAMRVDAGQSLNLALALCDLRKIAYDVTKDVTARFGDRFHVEIHGPAMGYWNGDALWRVLDNLLTKAAKYGHPDSPITTRIHATDGRTVIAVHNEGTIIPVADQAKLFQPFHRTDIAKTSGKGGWGLGLTLVRGIVEAHKGQVMVESYPSQGTTFTVDLPVDPRESTDGRTEEK